MSSEPTAGVPADYSEKDPWDILGSVALRTDPDSFLTKLLRHGVPAGNLLRSMATLDLVIWTPEQMAGVLTGWFQPTSLGEGGWWDSGVRTWTVEGWCNQLIVRPEKYNDEAKRALSILDLRYWASNGAGQEGLDSLGPSFVVTDTQCGVSILVDGSKRACAAYKLGLDRLVLHLQSHSARMLFPAEFISSVVSWGATQLVMTTVNNLDGR